MNAIQFSNWESALAGSGFHEGKQRSFTITIRWYLGWLKRRRELATCANARQFIAEMEACRQPEAWMVDRWKQALRWFFLSAPVRIPISPKSRRFPARNSSTRTSNQRVPGQSQDVCHPDTPKEENNHTNEAENGFSGAGNAILLDRSRELLRVRHMSLATERSYLGWIRRFLRFCEPGGSGDPDEELLRRFLTHLAVNEQVGCSTQKQALNACVFLLREVMQGELGDFSDFIRGRSRKSIPVVLSKEKLQRLFDALPDRYRVMARLQYGAGLRLNELMRLRVKDLDFDRGQIAIRAGKGNKDRMVGLPPALPAYPSHFFPGPKRLKPC